ncbi:MAG TPA: substrate-binding domain-containing protein, partial [Candidatus Limnocylindria bacterium]|nr:substrate-binding domain-containing protein [Candidatus Limnocylindria bacterium]
MATPRRESHQRALVTALAALVIATVACAPGRDPYAGVYPVKGGGAPAEVFRALSAEFSARHPGVRFDFEDVGSRSGMALLAGGHIDLATSSTEPDATVRESVRLLSVGVSGTAVIVSSGNPVTGLTRAQVRDIFSGTITDWAALGGAPGRIFVMTRNPNSAIRANFDSYFFETKPTYGKDVAELNDTEEMLSAVGARRDVIGIATINGRTLAEPKIKMLAIDGVQASKETVASGAYPVRR